MSAAEQESRYTEEIVRAAQAVSRADCVLIMVGAGMGVDSGLPDFRGNGGMYAQDGPFLSSGLDLLDIATTKALTERPRLAWGFQMRMFEMFRDAEPHAGHEVLLEWTRARPYFVYTSNVDGQFQKAGFDPRRIVECHGSVHWLQSHMPENQEGEVWPIGDLSLEVDPETGEALGELPVCPRTGKLARLNVLMFGDFEWLITRTFEQEMAYEAWLERISSMRCVIVEAGAGVQIPSVHDQSEKLLRTLDDATLIRINPERLRSPEGTIYVQMGAAEALTRINELVV